MSLGQTVTWQARHFGLPFRMTSKITEYERPTHFVDEQVSGPFAFWWHEHRFEEQHGHSLMTDLVRDLVPFGATSGPRCSVRPSSGSRWGVVATYSECKNSSNPGK